MKSLVTNQIVWHISQKILKSKINEIVANMSRTTPFKYGYCLHFVISISVLPLFVKRIFLIFIKLKYSTLVFSERSVSIKQLTNLFKTSKNQDFILPEHILHQASRNRLLHPYRRKDYMHGNLLRAMLLLSGKLSVHCSTEG